MAQMRASASYIPGAHSLKFGYQGNVSHPSQSYFNFTPFIQYRFNNGVPNQLTQTAIFPGTVNYQRNILMTSFYAQDTYTRARLTLQGGIRYDGIGTGYPDAGVGGPDYQLMPTRIFYAAGTTDEIHWKDITPRVGAAYDLFGNGKTAIKVNVGKYLTALTASNSDLDLNPLIRTTPQTTRTWNDSFYPVGDPRRGNYVPDCDLRTSGANVECGAMDNQNFGKEIFTKSFDPDLIHGWGKRTYNWEMGVSLQQELLPRVGLTRWLLPPLVRQLLHREQPHDDDGRLHAVQHPDSSGSATAGRWRRRGDWVVQPGAEHGRPGGPVLAALVELRRDDRELARHRRERQRAAAERTHRSRRHEHRPSAPGQLRRAGGAARDLQLDEHHGRADDAGRHVDRRFGQPVLPRGRALPDLVPRPGHLCRARRSICTVSVTWRSDPGGELAANYVVTSAIAQPSLGRPLSSGNVTVNLVEPGTLYGARQNNLDMRIAKILRFRGTRAQFGVDVYNLLNTDVVTTYNEGYTAPTATSGSIWLTPNVDSARALRAAQHAARFLERQLPTSRLPTPKVGGWRLGVPIAEKPAFPRHADPKMRLFTSRAAQPATDCANQSVYTSRRRSTLTLHYTLSCREVSLPIHTVVV